MLISTMVMWSDNIKIWNGEVQGEGGHLLEGLFEEILSAHHQFHVAIHTICL